MRRPSREANCWRDVWQAATSPAPIAMSLAASSFEGPRRPYRERLSAPRGAERAMAWIRVTLAAGVDLHYLPSGDDRRDAAIQGIVRDADKRLAPFD
jgi:hypothetical protein